MSGAGRLPLPACAVKIPPAATVACGWSDVADGYLEGNKGAARCVAELYPDGWTALATYPNASPARIKNIDPAKGLAVDLLRSHVHLDAVTAHLIIFTVDNGKRHVRERV